MRGLKLKQAMAVATQNAMGRLRMSAAVMAWSCRNSSTRPFLKFAWAGTNACLGRYPGLALIGPLSGILFRIMGR